MALPNRETPDIPLDDGQEVRLPAAAITELLVKLYVRLGMFQVEAEVVAERQIEADLRGIHSHGSRATPRYIQGMEQGHIDPRGQVLTVKQTPAIAVLDGGRNLGHVATTRAMRMAIDMARAVGSGTVAIRNSQHFGAASVYALIAAEQGMLGFATTSTAYPTVAAFGSRQPATANHALAWAAPGRGGSPFCLDMACAVAAWGKVESLKMYGSPMPPGWALDAEGNATTDPAQAKTLLPAAGARGYGLSLVASLLAGPLAGGRMPIHKTRGVEIDGSEHFVQVLDIAQFVDLDEFHAETESTFAAIRQLPPAEGFDRVRIPGDLEWERAQTWRQTGIPLHREHVSSLEKLADRHKVRVPWPRQST